LTAAETARAPSFDASSGTRGRQARLNDGDRWIMFTEASYFIFQRIADRSGRGTRMKEIGFIGLPEYAGAEQALNKLVASDVA
jgi:hypothetical protein